VQAQGCRRVNSTPALIESPLVLVADDDPTQLIVLQEVLERAGFRVLTAHNGKMAMEHYQQANPDIVLLDVEMPLMSGLEVCKSIRASETDRQTPIFIITGLEDQAAVEIAYEVGATDFLNKPIVWPVLPHRLRFALRAHHAFNELRGLVRAVPDSIFIVNRDGVVVENVSSTDPNQTQQLKALTTASLIKFYSFDKDEKAIASIMRAIKDGGAQIHEIELEDFNVHLEARFIARDDNSVLAIVRDITQRKKDEKKIHDLAFYDSLTELPNRLLFSRSLDSAIASARRDAKNFAILFVDLDRFKRINDTLGHSIGDQLLKSVASRLEECTRSTDNRAHLGQTSEGDISLARFGGDEFVLKLNGVSSESIASRVAARIISVLTPPFNCDGHQFVVTPSIGIAMFPEDGRTGEELIMNADSAMYRAKAAGRNNFKFFSETMRVKSLHRLDLETEIRKAINQQEFQLYFQPKVDIDSWSVIGAEALLRWNHPERGWISPDRFIPVAEETGLITLIDRWVLRKACEQVRAMSGLTSRQIPVSINISAHSFHAGGLVDDVLGVVSDTGIEACSIELEVTESVLLHDLDATVVAMNRLKEAGVGLSIDDFGTGYSSFSYLKQLPIDTIKIDRSFVASLHTDESDAAICAAIIAMAKKLGLKVVAEGVEKEEQIEFLKRQGCDQMQGFLFSPAVPAAEFEKLILDRPALASVSK
jgi:diguanylate cyclase (GGDEF)-like protein